MTQAKSRSEHKSPNKAASGRVAVVRRDVPKDMKNQQVFEPRKWQPRALTKKNVMNNAGQHANGFTHGKNLDRTAGEFIGAPLKGRAKRKTVSLERLSTELSGALRDRRCAWSKDLSPTQQGTDRPFPPSTKD